MASRDSRGGRTTWHRWPLTLGALVAALGLVLLPISSPRPARAASSAEAVQLAGETQTSEGGGVTVTVTWQGPGAGPIFAVVLDTHTVDLDGYDLLLLAVLRNGQGLEAQPTGWDAPAGSHHREGTLTFPATAADGTPLIGPGAGTYELAIRDIAGVPERVFRWTP